MKKISYVLIIQLAIATTYLIVTSFNIRYTFNLENFLHPDFKDESTYSFMFDESIFTSVSSEEFMGPLEPPLTATPRSAAADANMLTTSATNTGVTHTRRRTPESYGVLAAMWMTNPATIKNRKPNNAATCNTNENSFSLSFVISLPPGSKLILRFVREFYARVCRRNANTT